jgi:hypothetical protein
LKFFIEFKSITIQVAIQATATTSFTADEAHRINVCDIGGEFIHFELTYQLDYG